MHFPEGAEGDCSMAQEDVLITIGISLMCSCDACSHHMPAQSLVGIFAIIIPARTRWRVAAPDWDIQRSMNVFFEVFSALYCRLRMD